MMFWLKLNFRRYLKMLWPAAEVPRRKAIASTILGSLVIFGWVSGDYSRLYLFSAFFDPSFQGKSAFFVTFTVTVLASSFSFGYLILELYFWVEIETRSKYRSILRWLNEKGVTQKTEFEDFSQMLAFSRKLIQRGSHR